MSKFEPISLQILVIVSESNIDVDTLLRMSNKNIIPSQMPLTSIGSKLSSKIFKYYEDFATNKKIGRGDEFVIVGVTIFTPMFDFAISVIFSVSFSSF